MFDNNLIHVNQYAILTPNLINLNDCGGNAFFDGTYKKTYKKQVRKQFKVQNSGSAPSDCTPSLVSLGTANNPNYSGTAGRDYMHYYQQLHPILPVASNKS